jgi:hypothetical protein
VRALVRRCFTGKGSDDDTRRAAQLMAKEPEEYRTLSQTVRSEVRDEMRFW